MLQTKPVVLSVFSICLVCLPCLSTYLGTAFTSHRISSALRVAQVDHRRRRVATKLVRGTAASTTDVMAAGGSRRTATSSAVPERTLIQREITAVVASRQLRAGAAAGALAPAPCRVVHDPGDLRIDDSGDEQRHKVEEYQVRHEKVDILLGGDAKVTNDPVRMALVNVLDHGEAEPGRAVDERQAPHAVDDLSGATHGADLLRQHRPQHGNVALNGEGQNTDLKKEKVRIK